MASPVHAFGQPKAREDVVTCEVAGTVVDAVEFQPLIEEVVYESFALGIV